MLICPECQVEFDVERMIPDAPEYCPMCGSYIPQVYIGPLLTAYLKWGIFDQEEE